MNKIFYIFFIFIFVLPAKGERSYLLWESDPHQDTCQLRENTIWIENDKVKNCVQYFIDNKNTKSAIIQFYGDKDVSAKKNIREINNNTYNSQLEILKNKSKYFDITYVVIARPGTYGSSGSYKNKRTLEEFMTINYAVDKLKNKYGFEKIIIVGHSGGATVGASLLTLGRSDILCSLLISGSYGYYARAAIRGIENNKSAFSYNYKYLRNKYDPYDYISKIKNSKNRKIIIAGDIKDSVTPFALQVAFAGKLKSHSYNVEIKNIEALAPQYHNISNKVLIDNIKNCMVL